MQLDERVVLVCLIQSFKRRFVISRIERNVVFQVREELCLLGNGAFVEDRLGRSNMLLCFLVVASPGSNSEPARAPTGNSTGLGEQA